MAKRVIEDATLAGIAEAIREKAKTTDSLTPLQMPGAILDIKGAEVEEVTNSAGGKSVYINSEVPKVPKLPEGYTRLQYIKADGNQYLDTQFVPDTDTRLELDFTWDYIDPTEWTWMSAMGVRDTSNGTMQMHLTAETTQSYAGFSAQEISPTPGFYNPSTRYNIALDKNGVTVNGVPGGTFTAGQTMSTTLSIYLFRRNDNGSPSGNKFYGKVYGGRIIGGTTLARDYIPCRNESGVAGLYDMVNGVFYADNAGVGFLAGPEYAETVSKVVLEERVLVDLTNDTVTPEGLLAGMTAHDASGAQIIGELVQKAGGRPFAHGTATCATSGTVKINITGLPFTPTIVFVTDTNIGGLKSYVAEVFRDQENSRYYYWRYASGYMNQELSQNILSIKDGGFELLYVYPYVTTFATSYHWYAIGAEG